MNDSLRKALNRAEEIVATWPVWKQTSLLVTAMATTPHPRDPVIADAGASAGYGDSRSQHGAESLPIGWSVWIAEDRVVGNEYCIGGMGTPQTQSKSLTIPMPKEFLESIADIDMQFMDEHNGPGYYWCPACSEKASVRWHWGRMQGSGLDIEHEKTCPIRIAREILGY